MKKDKIICFDIETTGLDPFRDEILQLSIVDGHGKVLFDELIKPEDHSEWEEAAAINGITPEMVADKQPFSHWLPTVQQIFDNADLIVGYNCDGFDLAFMEQAGLTVDSKPTFDVMLEFAPIYGDYDERHGDYRWQKLATCANHYKYNGQKWHNSLDDTQATLHCYYGVLSDLQWTVTEDEVLEPKTLKVLLIEPQKQPRIIEIENSLESLQRAVGDHIEHLYPFEDPVALVCAENGKFNGKRLNRALYNEQGLYDIIAGSFLVVGIRGDGLCSLGSGQANKFTARFSPPELFYRGEDGHIKVMTVPGEPMLTKPITELTVQDGVDAVFLPGKIHGSEDQLYIIYLNAESNGGIGDGSWEIEVVDYDRILRLYAEVGGDADRFFDTLPDMYHGEWYYCDSKSDPEAFKEYQEAYLRADFIVGRDGDIRDEMMFLVNWAEKRAEQVKQEALPAQSSTEPPKEKKGSVRL